MLKRLIDFETRYHAKQVGFWVVIAVMLVYGLLVALLPDIVGNGLSGSRLKANGAQMIAGGLSGAYLPIIFFGGIFTVTGILRDKTSNMLEIVHATPVSTRDMTLSRMVGIFGVLCIAFFVFLVAQFLGQLSPTLDKETLGPVNPLYYLQPFILLTVVNALFVTAFFTLIAGLTQNRMLVLVSAIGLFFFSLMVGVVTELDIPKWVQAVADPFGSLAYGFDTEFMNPQQRNTELLPLTGYVGLNRLVWTLISLGILALVFGKFKRGLITGRTRRAKVEMKGTGLSYSGVAQTSGFMSDLAAVWTRFKFEYLTTVRSVPFIILASLAVALFALIIIITVFFSPQKLIPTSLIISRLGFTFFAIPIILIIAFFAGEISFRDRGAKFHELLDSTSVNNWPLLAGKWLALFAVVFSLCFFGMLVSMSIQLMTDSPPVDFGLYLGFTFLNVFPNYLFMAALAMMVQMFVPNRIIGMLAAGGALAALLFIGRLPFYHPLMGFGGTSPGPVSEISPYNNWIYFRWFNFYWGMFVLAFTVLGVWMWHRGLQVSFLTRLRYVGRRVTPVSGGVMALALAGFIGSGIYIFQAYDKVDWNNRNDREARQVRGEALFKREMDLPRPHTRAVKVDAQIYPSIQEALISGTMELQNASGEPITELYVQPSTGHEEDMRVLAVTGATEVTSGENDDGDSLKDIRDFDVRLFRFDPPLADGATATLDFEVFLHGPRLADRSSVSKNGTFMNNYATFGGSPRVIPVFGPPDLAIQSKKRRRKLGLEELPKLPEPTAEGMDLNIFGALTGPADMIDFEGRICTEAPQTPIAPGNLIAEETVEGRTCRTYKTTQPISNFFSMLSGDYAVTEDSWTAPDGKVIPIRVYHAAHHDYSVDDMIRATQFSLGHYTEHFSPYQYDYVRIMEVPFIGFAQAFAGTIPFSESGFIMDAGDPDDVKTLDNASAITMHEMGHQWFAHQIVPGYSRGFNVLSEGLTSYITLDAYEAMYGFDKALFLLENGTIAQYMALSMFDSQAEVPLAVARDQQYLVYNKADWVMWSLKHHIGPQNMRDAMKGFIEEYGLKGPPYPTTKTLTNVLREAAGPEYDQLITDQWDRMVQWKFGYGDDGPTVSENADGTWRVTIPVNTQKDIQTEEMEKFESWADMDGEVLNEPLEIGIYTDEPKKLWSAWTQLERVWVTQEDQVFSFDVVEKPTHIALDPRRIMLEFQNTNNVQTVGEASAYRR
ncbi:ABC transporter permease [Litorimonas sp. WD9-15]|uniref:ABC transporter permease n=1 Tax=Litorimonas sp. WD9-15 TaxID=3418716 RepID=UPI003D085B28